MKFFIEVNTVQQIYDQKVGNIEFLRDFMKFENDNFINLKFLCEREHVKNNKNMFNL